MKQTTLQTIRSFKLILTLVASVFLFACQSETSAKGPGPDESKYTVLQTPITVSTGDKIEVTELFWFGCSHCFALEPQVKTWLKTSKPENVTFVKVPATFNKSWEFHGKAYYTMEALGVLDKATDAFFHRIHVLRKPISNLDSLVEFLSDYDFTEAQVSDAFNSFAVDTKLRNAKKITGLSTARGVPAILVDGKYHTSVQLAGGQSQLFDVINQLTEKAAEER